MNDDPIMNAARRRIAAHDAAIRAVQRARNVAMTGGRTDMSVPDAIDRLLAFIETVGEEAAMQAEAKK